MASYWTVFGTDLESSRFKGQYRTCSFTKRPAEPGESESAAEKGDSLIRRPRQLQKASLTRSWQSTTSAQIPKGTASRNHGEKQETVAIIAVATAKR